jgi:hypothetical protein
MINCNCKDCMHNNHEDCTCKLEEIWIDGSMSPSLPPMCSSFERKDDED